MGPIIIIIPLFVFIFFIAWVLLPSCPGCERKGTLRWLHQRNGGKPDGRYKNNYQICSRCGWVSPREAERRSAAEAADRQAQADRQREAEMLQQEAILWASEAPHRAFLWILKYVAMADRRFMEGERQAIFSIVKKIYPQERQSKALRWVEDLSPDPFNLTEMLTIFQGASEDERKDLLRILNDMATADGKATKTELARINEVRKVLES